MLADGASASAPIEGAHYKTINVGGHSFTIRYGYYDELDRQQGEPIPVFPDFLRTPLYTAEGYPFCTRIQDACARYTPKNGRGDDWCADCAFYPGAMEEIGVCRCEDCKTNRFCLNETNEEDTK